MPHRLARLNKVGIPIVEPVRPSEQFYCVYDGLDPASTRGKSLKFRRAAYPSRLKNTD